MISELLAFTVTGQPRAKGRPRFVRATGGVYTDRKTAAYENLIALSAREAINRDPEVRDNLPAEGALVVDVLAFLQRPISAKKRPFPFVRPDLDNLVKAALDGLNQAGTWRDDAQVCRITANKRYGEPGLRIVVYQLVADDVETP